MKLKDGATSVPTIAGLILSILMPILLVGYGVQKFDILINKKDAKIFSTDLIDNIPDTKVFGTNVGLKIAVAFVEFPSKEGDDPEEPVLDKEYGRIAFYREAYGFVNNNTVDYEYVDLPAHQCTREELNLDKWTENIGNEENVFFHTAKRYQTDLNLHQKKFMCIEPEDMRMQGDYNSETASLIHIKIEKCTDHDYCKSEEEIDEFFKTDKYMLMLNNQIRFDSNKHEEESIIRESVLQWLPLDIEGLFSQQYQLKTGESNLQDLIVDFDSLTEFQDDIMKIEYSKLLPRRKDTNVPMYLAFEVSLNKHIITREHFSVLDLLGDIGGVQAALFSIVHTVLFFLNYRYFDQYMASKLYKIKKPEDEEQKSRTYFERSNFFKPSKLRNLRDYVIDSLPNRIKCCKETRQ